MNGLLVRVGADQSEGGGSWHGIVDNATGHFVYVSIPENLPVHPGAETPYDKLAPALARFGVSLPAHLMGRNMHLDPDFKHLTYGDHGVRAQQLKASLRPDDLLVFYASLRDLHHKGSLIYAIIGLFVVEKITSALQVAARDRYINAHSRRILPKGANDIIVYGRPVLSGRLETCIPVGEYRDRAYRVKNEILDAWGGLSVKNGYLQRSARLPRLLNPVKFKRWFDEQHPSLLHMNN